jgi:DNA-directed RNA polymerase sigma subunit (sigma70/sigma32)
MEALKPVRTQKEVGEILGVSLQAVQQVEYRALKKLRKRLAERLGYEEYSTSAQPVTAPDRNSADTF